MIHDLEPFRIRLHQPVLDPVVNHLHEVAGARRSDVRIAVLGCERLEDRPQPFHRLVVAADHRAEADLESPDPARDARVDEVDALVLRLDVAPLRVAEVGVAAVDDRVALFGERQQLLEDVLGDLPRRHHHPERARRLELFLQLFH